MASNSKKRRRVLGVSCILAALIIASSSFAWFTSKDEVTNRLTASADYNVSVIENFVPPKQWTPGQKVTKEEAVVNTGNIDAFVKQQITGDLKVTVELPTTVAPTADNLETTKYIELKPEEYGSIEAGSYLAWGPDASQIGTKIIYAMDTSTELSPNGHALPQETDFTPAADGLYIFRRAVTTDASMTDTKYEYVGYYYLDGKYYKLNDIDKNTLVLADSGNGNLASAPTVKYGYEKTEIKKTVPMVYDEANSVLKLSYSTDSNPDLSALAVNDRAIYDAYRNYLNAQTGKTKWDASRGDGTAADTDNHSGLINYDEFDPGAEANTVLDDLTNWSMDRLTKRAEETKAALDAVSPAGEFTDANWKTVYDEAVAERKTVNKGVKSSQRLATLRDTTVIPLIGTGTYGLVQDATYPFHYSASATTADPTADPFKVVLQNPTTQKSSDIPAGYNASDPAYMTIDNMDMARFQDPYFVVDNSTPDKSKDGTFGSDVKWNVPNTPYDASVTNTALKNAWDNYVQQTKRMILVDKKIEILTAYTTTDVGRNDTERVNYLNVLKSNKAAIQADLDVAKTAYETQSTAVDGYLTQLNKYQDDVNAANEVTGTNYGATSSDVNSYPTDANGYKSVVKGTNPGEPDTGKETTLKNYLEAVYGVAYKDSGYDATTAVYVGTQDGSGTSAVQDADEYADFFTYSPTVTKAKIDNSLEEDGTTGKIKWTATTMLQNDGDDALVQAKPYYIDRKVNMMKDRRDHQINDVKDKGTPPAAADGLYEIYRKALAASNSAIDTAASVGPIEILVHLANLDGTGATAEKWQYIADATPPGGPAANEYNFYYTSILPSGQTSKLLIESVEMSPNVTQDMFRDLQFDLNVNAESAQVVYDGDIARPTSANETLSGAKTTDDGYRTGDVVTWAKDGTAKTAPTDRDPNPKEDAEVPAETVVTAATYSVAANGAKDQNNDDIAHALTITKVPAVSIGGNEYKYKIVDGGKTYYGANTTATTVFTEVEDDTAATKVFVATDPATITLSADATAN